jgi:hypothetical protein
VADVARRVVRDGLKGRVPTLDPGHQPAGLGLSGRGGDGAGGHPTLATGEAGVDRTGSSDPGHS